MYRHTSSCNTLVVAILLCSLVCSITGVTFGRVTSPQDFRVVKKQSVTTQVTSQLAEKSESETDTKHHTPLFLIQTVIQSFRVDLTAPQYLGLVSATRFGNFLNLIPIYLVERTIRI